MDTGLGSDAELDSGWRQLVADGIVAGLAGAVALAVPLVVWDWAHAAHRALELPMAATAWPFGLEHFSNEQNVWWPIVIGAALLPQNEDEFGRKVLHAA